MKLNAFVVLCTASLLLSACGLYQGDQASSTPATPEPPYLGAQKTSYGSTPFQVKITGKFKYRPTVLGSGSTTGLYPPNSNTIEPIPFAEYQVYNSAGDLVQAGETDTNGMAIIDMPSTAGNYTAKIFSRALNTNLKISVLADKYNNQPYSISKDFTVTSTNISGGSPYDIGDIVAEADEAISSAIEGGAFNIYFDILLANEFIRGKIAQPSWVAEKVTVYWKAGFNPYTYYSKNGGAGLSFYVPVERKLYILGGSNGDVRSSDTDHFDDSIILHEYGHFLEDVYGHSDSPGGSHDGNFIIDPRLAWSEGWANYFQSAVLSNSTSVPTDNNGRAHYYIDTYGYKNSVGDTRGGMLMAIDMNASPTGLGVKDSPGVDEGEFREMSIARTLYKATRSPASTVGGTPNAGGDVPFSKIWTTFSGNSPSSPIANSLRNSNDYPTPSMGLFLQLLKLNLSPASTTNLDAILSNEKQRSDTREYADEVNWTTGPACSRTLTGMPESYFSSDPVPRTNLLKNNDFLLYYYSGQAADAVIALSYTPINSSSGIAMDLDLIVYAASYIYQEDFNYYSGYSNAYIVKQSRRDPLYEARCGFDSSKSCEAISLSGQPAGWYMIDVKVSGYYRTPSGSYQARIPTQIDASVPYNLTNSNKTRYLCP